MPFYNADAEENWNQHLYYRGNAPRSDDTQGHNMTLPSSGTFS